MIRRNSRRRRGTASARASDAADGQRRGAALIEAAVILGIFLTLLLGSLDLMLIVLRDNTLSQAARRLARAALVRGEGAAGFLQPWGPAPYAGTADEDTAQAAAIRGILVAVDPADVQVQMSWPDGGNATGDRVRVVVSMQHQSTVASLFGVEPYLLTSTAIMQIEH